MSGMKTCWTVLWKRLTAGAWTGFLKLPGSPVVFKDLHKYAAPGGCIVLVGIPADGMAQFSITGLQARELHLETVFRYAHKYDRAIRLIASGDIDLNP